MKTLMTSIVIATGALAFTSLAAGTAKAQQYTKQYGEQRFASQHPSSVAGCPSLAWRLVMDPNGNVNGLTWFTDMSGASQVKGMMSPQTGQIHLTLTSTQGNGPVGTVTGTRTTTAQGGTTTRARLTGQGCANMDLDLRPLVGQGWGAGG